ncbi:YheC/YheD family protein [Paenibacillus sediminis]|uniref:Glutathione synthase/RimK-type ligase-like ATP-grasp enzyme n=1 Tax=Paenibacillus sediminis TaxID=664909 RepID=A0ABS4H5L3_9BACL|nr:YheC/YheD family protein [Paenibacillus sediminis]MBP1937823.1 glutathione synthase/RimK-type ligase-like ATP-grasp enzyme [Paenibacillus sediminis]
MNRIESRTIGIMESEASGFPPFTEQSFCRKLSIAGMKYGIRIFVFCPNWIDQERLKITGYHYMNGRWESVVFPFPQVIYDRCLYHSSDTKTRARRQIASLAEKQGTIFLGNPLSGKWSVYQSLKRHKEIAPYLPRTVRYEGTAQLKHWMSEHQEEALLKPQSGTHGKNVLRVKMTDTDQFLVAGRDSLNRIIQHQFTDEKALMIWIDRFTKGRTFLIQPYLELNNAESEPFDIRVLIQKNEHGRWTLTGMAIRKGKPESLTSNLHGGGSAERVMPFLKKLFGKEATEAAVVLMRSLSFIIAEHLENYYGRLAELGIDFGIDRRGQVWILEVNSKPGRSSFFRIGDMNSAIKAIENPVVYARYLLLRQLRRVIS